jgi:hypothetical protein
MTAATATAPLLGSMKFDRDDADSASFVTTLDEERDVRILAKSRIFAVPAQPARCVVVELRPRTFTEIAAHFQSVTTPVTWPTDEPDID